MVRRNQHLCLSDDIPMCVGYQGHGGVLGSVEQTQAKFNLLGTSTMMAVMLQVAMAPRRLRHYFMPIKEV